MSLDGVQNYIIGVIIFVLVVSGGVFMIGSFFSSDATLDSGGNVNQFNSTLNRAENITNAVNKIDSDIQGVTSGNSGALGWLNAITGAAFGSLQAIGSSLGFMKVATTEAAALFGIPAFVVPLIFLIVIVIIGFAIWSAILRQ